MVTNVRGMALKFNFSRLGVDGTMWVVPLREIARP